MPAAPRPRWPAVDWSASSVLPGGVDPDGRQRRVQAGDYVVAEALTNVAKHAGDATVEVEVATADGGSGWGYAMTGGGPTPPGVRWSGGGAGWRAPAAPCGSTARPG